MQKLITILTLLLISQVLFAQAPQATSYQAVIRNSSGNVLSNQLVKVRFSIRDSAANGTVVYQETQNPTTNAQGLINLFAGKGTAVIGTFAGINWGNKSKFLQTEIDIAGGSNYTDMGTMQLMSVPYALYSNNGNPNGNTVGEMLYWNGTTWVKVTPGTYGQSLTICEGVPTWGGCSPKITTTAASTISYTTATSGGNVTAEGGVSVTSRGVCWSTAINPTIALSTKTVNGTGAGSFTSSITGLTANTLYHVRSYATNSVGTAYGADVTFRTLSANSPTLTTTTPTSITSNTSISGGTITNDGGATITARGVCWSTTANPTIALTTKTVDGTGTGAFTSSITGLNSNTLYYVRAYATNGAGTSYGAQVSFTTLRLPSVTTGTLTNINYFSATASGNVTDSGSRAITARGVCYATTPSPTITNGTVVTNGSNVTGAFTVSLTGLSANTRYYVRAFVTTSVGTSYGVDSVFTPANSCFESNVNLNDLLGNYNNTNEDFGGAFGPYTTSITSVNQTSATTGTIVVNNLFDNGWAPITFTLDWTNPANRTVTLATQTNIAPASTVSSNPAYATWLIQVGPSPTEGPGTFSICNQTLTLKIRVGIADPTGVNSGWFGTPYTVNMAR